MISVLVVDDDINKISSIIASIKTNYIGQTEIIQASNVQEALDILKFNHFHLLIVDLLLPIRNKEPPIETGGQLLIKELYKKRNNSNVPIYIVGLTAFEQIKHYFSSVWMVWQYEAENMEWQHKLRDLIFHISKIDSKIAKVKKETLFVEGSTDKEVIKLVFELFFEPYKDKVTIEAINFSGGSSWVARQLIIWGNTLFLKTKDNYLQAVGLFDNDKAGQDAISDVRKQIPNDSAACTTFSIVSLDKKHIKHLMPCFQGGLMLPITLEEMFAPFCWEHAESNNWLDERIISDELLQDPKRWNKMTQTLLDYIATLKLSKEVNLYVRKKISEDKKINFVNYIKQLNIAKQREALYAFEPLIDDILKKMKLKL